MALIMRVSRSHVRRPDAGTTDWPKTKGDRNTQPVNGPAHYNRRVIGATGQERINQKGENAYDLPLWEVVLRPCDGILEPALQNRKLHDPFFLYYPIIQIMGRTSIGKSIKSGAGRMVSGDPASIRLDYIYENGIALGRLLDFLERPEILADPAETSR